MSEKPKSDEELLTRSFEGIYADLFQTTDKINCEISRLYRKVEETATEDRDEALQFVSEMSLAVMRASYECFTLPAPPITSHNCRCTIIPFLQKGHS